MINSNTMWSFLLSQNLNFNLITHPGYSLIRLDNKLDMSFKQMFIKLANALGAVSSLYELHSTQSQTRVHALQFYYTPHVYPLWHTLLMFRSYVSNILIQQIPQLLS
jgi:hypothetical protein